ncbi:MAG TPA: hypothetical protein EYN66_03630, partial [Myxococcales bacterium]|nr:hypothetical protein [Myxococcales bacterium]
MQDHTAQVRVNSSGLAEEIIAVNISNIEVNTLTLSSSAIVLNEGGTASFNASLAMAPDGTETIAISSSNAARLGITPSQIIFNANNYNTPQAVILNGLQDTDLIDNNASVTLSGTNVGSSIVTVTIQDDDIQTILATPASLSADEGGNTSFTVQLSHQPASNVSATLSSSDNTVASLSTQSLVFTSANWNQGLSVTITGEQDNDLANDQALITLLSNGLGNTSVNITIRDDDSQAFIVSTNSVTVDEGSSIQFSVRLAYQPTNTQSASLLLADASLLSVSPVSLSFSPANYAVPQIITINGLEDANVANDNSNVRVTGAGLPDAIVAVSITDNDAQTFVFSSQSVSLNEGEIRTFTVSLSGQPLAEKIVSLASSDPGAVTVSPAQLTFTSANHLSPQTVTLRAIQDLDDGNESVSISLAAANMSTANVAVTVNDDETQAIIASETNITTNEATNATFTIRLAAQPLSNVVVSIASNDTSIATVTPSNRTFTPSNWNQGQAITVTGVNDLNANDDLTSLTLSANNISATIVPVTIIDDDAQSIIINRSTLIVNEGGTNQLTVQLRFAPAANFTVNTSMDNALLSTNPSAITFTPANYSTPQTVIVTGVQDGDMVDNQTVLRFTGSGLSDRVVSVTVVDDDSQALSVSVNNLNMTEGDVTNFNVQLQFQPLGEVNVYAASSATSIVRTQPVRLRFNASNWNTPQVVTVTAPHDADLSNGSASIVVRASDLSNRYIAVTVADDDSQAIIVDSANLTVLEGGSRNTQVRMAFQPANDVTVSINSADSNIAQPNLASITFTSNNYDTTQVVSISGEQDADTVDGNTQITYASTGLSDVNVTATVIDDDVINISASPSNLGLTEGGASGQFVVTLTQQPAATTVVSVTSVDSGAATVTPTSLSFTDANWNTPQTVIVNPVNDNDASGESISISLIASGMATRNVSVSVADDDQQALILSPANLVLNEGDSADIQVSLAYAPLVSATVNIASSDATSVSASQSTLTFTNANYNTPQALSVLAEQDNDIANDTATIDFEVPGAAIASAVVTVSDDDVQVIVTSTTSIEVVEGLESIIAVSLAYVPTTTMTVDVSSSNGSIFTASPSTLTFTPSAFGAAQNVVLTGQEDTNAANEFAVLTLSSAGLSDSNVAVTVIDLDIQRLVLSATRVDVTEGGSGSFSVNLSHIPSVNVTVNLSSADGSITTVSPSSLTFAPSNATTPQTITVQAPEDSNVADASTTITVSANGIADAIVNAHVTDDDAQEVILSASILALNEGESGQVSLSLAYAPSSPFSVTVSSADPGAATVSPQTLTFTAGNYATTQSISITAVNDGDLADENVTLTVAATGLVDQTLALTISDDDVQSLILTQSDLSMNEGGISTVGVRLGFAPSADVTVSISNSDSGAVSVNASNLTFTSANYSTVQDIQITALQDLDSDDEDLILTLTESTSSASNSVTVNIVDDEVQAIVVSPGLVVLDEGSTGSFTVVLAHDPTGSVTVGLVSAVSAAATVTPSTLSFDSSNYTSPQTVVITGLEDNDTVMELVDIDLIAPNISSETVTAQINDNDQQDLVVSAAAITVNEDATSSFTVALAYEPVGTRTVNIASNAAGVSVVPQTLTFTAGNYAQVQTVSLIANADNNIANESALLTISSDNVPAKQVAVTVLDDDQLSIVLSAQVVSLVEGGTETLQASLNFEPLGTVTINVATSGVPATSELIRWFMQFDGFQLNPPP